MAGYAGTSIGLTGLIFLDVVWKAGLNVAKPAVDLLGERGPSQSAAPQMRAAAAAQPANTSVKLMALLCPVLQDQHERNHVGGQVGCEGP